MHLREFLGTPSDGQRTRVVEDLFGLRQNAFAGALGHSDEGRLVRYWQDPNSNKNPGQDSLEVIDARFGFAPAFFTPRREPPAAQPLFHKTSYARSAAAKRSRGFLQLVGELADAMTARRKLNAPSLPSLPGAGPNDAAQIVRQQLGLGAGPISHLIRTFESAGVAVAFAPLDERSLYSYGDTVLQRGVVVSNARSGDRYESRFWFAHEIAHLVLHPRGPIRDADDADLESDATIFAAELLTPSAEIRTDFDMIKNPVSQRWVEPNDIPWPALFELKEKWGVEVFSLLRRGIDTGALSKPEYELASRELSRLSSSYRRKMLKESAGRTLPPWITFREPGEHQGIEGPRALQTAILEAGRTQLSEYLGIPLRFIEAIASPFPVALDLSLSTGH